MRFEPDEGINKMRLGSDCEKMTVAELMAELKDVPQDVPVCVDSPANLDDGIDVLCQMERGRIVGVVLQ